MSRAPIIKMLVLYNVFEAAAGADTRPYTTLPRYDKERSLLANGVVEKVRELRDFIFDESRQSLRSFALFEEILSDIERGQHGNGQRRLLGDLSVDRADHIVHVRCHLLRELLTLTRKGYSDPKILTRMLFLSVVMTNAVFSFRSSTAPSSFIV